MNMIKSEIKRSLKKATSGMRNVPKIEEECSYEGVLRMQVQGEWADSEGSG